MKKSKKIRLAAGIIMLLIVAGGCLIYRNRPVPMEELELLASHLTGQGYTVQYEEARKDILEGKRYVISYDKKKFLNVFLYPTEKEAKKDASRLSKNGNTYTQGGITGYTMLIDYAEPIHYFRKKNMIVSWAGERDEMYQFLVDELGEQFIGN